MEALLGELKKVNGLEEVPEDQLNWLIEEGSCLAIRKGDHLFKAGDPIDRLLIILKGGLVFRVEQAGNFREAARVGAYSITGLLPYSRATNAIGYGEALDDLEVLALDKGKFPEMIQNQHELTAALVHVMSTRIRDFTRKQQQDDKMMALGKLSAGLAHELNNPSSAVMRNAHSLNKQFVEARKSARALMDLCPDSEQLDKLFELLKSRTKSVTKLSLMEMSDREDELLDWLEDHGIVDGEDISGELAEQGWRPSDLEQIAGVFAPENLRVVLTWLQYNYSIEMLSKEIADASGRIYELVNSIKSYTHMDQAPEKIPKDIHEGLDNTLNMLDHKIRKQGIQLEKSYSKLPKVPIFPGELNQVWTNIIDNAVDAMEELKHRVLTVKTRQEGDFVMIDIKDTGAGIPEEIRDRVFDPFFTTKSIGKGTGLGLEIVHQIVKDQHQGQIYLDSSNQGTTFSICLPINN